MKDNSFTIEYGIPPIQFKCDDIEYEVIQYGDPDNSGVDLAGKNQIYLRAEAYIGWGILAPAFFAKVQA